jgi:hypothetical protein
MSNSAVVAQKSVWSQNRLAGEDHDFYNRLCEPQALLAEARVIAKSLADGPTFAHAMTGFPQCSDPFMTESGN